ncbi:hypothetical protein D3C72_290380 [compost metagenome]
MAQDNASKTNARISVKVRDQSLSLSCIRQVRLSEDVQLVKRNPEAIHHSRVARICSSLQPPALNQFQGKQRLTITELQIRMPVACGR